MKAHLLAGQGKTVREGRTPEQKKQIVPDITAAFVKQGTPADAVHVIIYELPKQNFARGASWLRSRRVSIQELPFQHPHLPPLRKPENKDPKLAEMILARVEAARNTRGVAGSSTR